MGSYLDGLPFMKEMRPFYNQQGSAELEAIERDYGGTPKETVADASKPD